MYFPRDICNLNIHSLALQRDEPLGAVLDVTCVIVLFLSSSLASILSLQVHQHAIV